MKIDDMQCDDNLLCGVNSPKDWNAMTDLEKKHLPVIDAPEKVMRGKAFEVTITVGKLLAHPNEPGHFVQFLELYSGNTLLGRVDLVPEQASPRVVMTVALNHSHPLRAFAHCNLHGTWEYKKDIKLEG
ncbi:MAG: class II SORL domain-containing protein [archaeon]